MKITAIDVSKDEREEYPSPGRCIYCGSSEDLRDEHIIPHGLAAHSVIFRRASCRACGDLLNKEFEQYVLGVMLLPFRIRVGAPTRSKRRPDTLTMKFVCLDAARQPIGPVASKQIPADQFPLGMLGWRLPEPGILAGRPPTEEILGEPWTKVFEHEFAPHLEDYKRRTGHQGDVAASVGRMEQDKFFRFLAKVAHGFAIAGEGLDSFEPLALDLIFGRSREFCHLLGGDAEWPDPDDADETFRIAVGRVIEDECTYICVFLQVYPLFETPSYVVVVGRRERTEDEVSIFEHPTDAKHVKLTFPDWKGEPKA